MSVGQTNRNRNGKLQAIVVLFERCCEPYRVEYRLPVASRKS